MATPYTLDPLRVEARAERRSLASAGFYERQRAGMGYFVTEADIRRGAPLSSVMRTVPGVRVIRYTPPPPEKCGKMCGSPPTENRLVPGRNVGSARVSMAENNRSTDQCMMPVFKDGARVVNASPEQGNDIDRVSMSGVVAIEVYRNPTEIPAQYASADQGCGVVLMWTQAEPTPGQ